MCDEFYLNMMIIFQCYDDHMFSRQSLCCHHVSAAKQRSIRKTATPAAIKIHLLLFRWPPSSLSLSLSLSSSSFSQMQSHLWFLNQNNSPPARQVTIVTKSTAPAHRPLTMSQNKIQEAKSGKRASPVVLEAALAPFIGWKISPKGRKIPNCQKCF